MWFIPSKAHVGAPKRWGRGAFSVGLGFQLMNGFIHTRHTWIYKVRLLQKPHRLGLSKIPCIWPCDALPQLGTLPTKRPSPAVFLNLGADCY